MIRLFVENAGQANPNLALRWCVDKETLDELKEKGVKNPQLLLVVAQHPSQWSVREIERKLMPLDRAMEWLEFDCPGRHTIYATIVWDDDGQNFTTRLLSRSRSRFDYRMFNCDGKFSRSLEESIDKHSLDKGSLDVVVAKEFFAKEPPAWLNWWVNLWFGAMQVPKPTNQCSFRRRAILAFTIQPIPVFIWALLKSLTRLVVALAFVLCGMRGVSFKPIIHPFELCLHNVWWDMGSSVFLKDKGDKWRSPVLIPIIPIIPVSLFAILSIFNLGFWLAMMWAAGLVVGATALVFFTFLLISVVGLVGRGLRALWRALMPPPSAEEAKRRQQAEIERGRERRKQKEAERARKEKERQEREQREFAASYEELQDVACIGVPLRPKLELLPERRRTIYLRYRGLKALVCKQYPR